MAVKYQVLLSKVRKPKKDAKHQHCCSGVLPKLVSRLNTKSGNVSSGYSYKNTQTHSTIFIEGKGVYYNQLYKWWEMKLPIPNFKIFASKIARLIPKPKI